MEYEIDAITREKGWFSGAHEKTAKDFKKISEQRAMYGWTLHSYDTCVQGTMMLATIVWQRKR